MINKHGSLFSGIGGFDLASEWMGWDNVFHCEWNEFGQKVLKHYWPKATSYADITKTDFSIHRWSIDILTGGFPCQPYSQAGKRLGKEDDRHLWPEMLRAIREIQPRWVVGENVRGLTNWNGGLVFDEVQADLEAQGYEVTPFLLPACAVNAPHRRDRIWFIAYASMRNKFALSGGGKKASKLADITKFNENGTTSNTERIRQPRSGRAQGFVGSKENKNWEASWSNNVDRWPIQSPVCSGNDGLSGELDGITFREWSEQSLKAGGNAIVPQVAFQIFKAIEEYDTK